MFVVSLARWHVGRDRLSSGLSRAGTDAVRLRLEQQRQERIERILDTSVVVAALATFPLMLAYFRQWDGGWIVAGDWIVWSVFASEFAFLMSVSRDRWRTTREQWLMVVVVILSFPLSPQILAWSRLVRLARGVRIARGARLLRPARLTRLLHFGRLYLMRSTGGRRLFARIGHIPAQWRLFSRLLGRGERASSSDRR